MLNIYIGVESRSLDTEPPRGNMLIIVWVTFIIFFSLLGGLASKRLAAGTRTAGDQFMVAGSVFFVGAGIVALTIDPTPAARIVAFALAATGGISVLIAVMSGSDDQQD